MLVKALQSGIKYIQDVMIEKRGCLFAWPYWQSSTDGTQAPSPLWSGLHTALANH